MIVMLNKAFQYDIYNQKWIECTEEKFINEDIENLPCTFVINYENKNKSVTKEVFCNEHRKFEMVKEIDYKYVISKQNCKFNGLIGFAKYSYSDYLYGYEKYVPIRWRIFQRNLNDYINLACDVAHIRLNVTSMLKNWNNFTITINISTRRLFITKLKVDGKLFDWTEATNIEISQIIVDIVIEAMRESTYLTSGIKPSVLSKMTGYKKIIAFFERPFDLNIVFLKNFFKEYNFDITFPYETKDNYKLMCDILKIKPPKSLRKAYAYNPYSIVIYMILRQLGINDINFIQKFFYIDNCIGNFYLSNFYFNIKYKRVMHIEAQNLWLKFEYYCKWLKNNKSEKYLANWLYHLSTQKDLTRWQLDTIESFYLYESSLSAESKKILLNKGITQQVHDIIAAEVTMLSHNWKNVKIDYKPYILEYECKLDNYEFRLVHYTKELIRISIDLDNCVASYYEKILNKESIIITAQHKGKYVACIEMKDLRTFRIINQALGLQNRRLDGKLLDVCRKWVKLKKLAVVLDYSEIYEE